MAASGIAWQDKGPEIRINGHCGLSISATPGIIMSPDGLGLDKGVRMRKSGKNNRSLRRKVRSHMYQPTIGEELEAVHPDRAVKTHPADNRKRRSLVLKRDSPTTSWGFTIQSYGIHHKRREELEMVTFVDYVELGGPAFMAGLRAGDVIMSVNGAIVDDVKHDVIVSHIKTSTETMRLVVMFENVCRKVELHQRKLKLQKLLVAKETELAAIEDALLSTTLGQSLVDPRRMSLTSSSGSSSAHWSGRDPDETSMAAHSDSMSVASGFTGLQKDVVRPGSLLTNGRCSPASMTSSLNLYSPGSVTSSADIYSPGSVTSSRASWNGTGSSGSVTSLTDMDSPGLCNGKMPPPDRVLASRNSNTELSSSGGVYPSDSTAPATTPPPLPSPLPSSLPSPLTSPLPSLYAGVRLNGSLDRRYTLLPRNNSAPATTSGRDTTSGNPMALPGAGYYHSNGDYSPGCSPDFVFTAGTIPNYGSLPVRGRKHRSSTLFLDAKFGADYGYAFNPGHEQSGIAQTPSPGTHPLGIRNTPSPTPSPDPGSSSTPGGPPCSCSPSPSSPHSPRDRTKLGGFARRSRSRSSSRSLSFRGSFRHRMKPSSWDSYQESADFVVTEDNSRLASDPELLVLKRSGLELRSPSVRVLDSRDHVICDESAGSMAEFEDSGFALDPCPCGSGSASPDRGRGLQVKSDDRTVSESASCPEISRHALGPVTATAEVVACSDIPTSTIVYNVNARLTARGSSHVTSSRGYQPTVDDVITPDPDKVEAGIDRGHPKCKTHGFASEVKSPDYSSRSMEYCNGQIRSRSSSKTSATFNVNVASAVKALERSRSGAGDQGHELPLRRPASQENQEFLYYRDVIFTDAYGSETALDRAVANPDRSKVRFKGIKVYSKSKKVLGVEPKYINKQDEMTKL